MNRELYVESYYCDLDHRIELLFTCEEWELLKNSLLGMEIKVIEHELTCPIIQSPRHRAKEILTAVYEIQGLKLEEGTEILPAIESLVDKYAALK